MSKAPLNEVIVSITNILRKSTEGKMFFDHSDAGEERFDNWQKMLLTCTDIIHDSWNDESNICEQAITTFEKVFSTPFTIKEHAQ
jgi:hypothetical protein